MEGEVGVGDLWKKREGEAIALSLSSDEVCALKAAIQKTVFPLSEKREPPLFAASARKLGEGKGFLGDVLRVDCSFSPSLSAQSETRTFLLKRTVPASHPAFPLLTSYSLHRREVAMYRLLDLYSSFLLPLSSVPYDDVSRVFGFVPKHYHSKITQIHSKGGVGGEGEREREGEEERGEEGFLVLEFMENAEPIPLPLGISHHRLQEVSLSLSLSFNE